MSCSHIMSGMLLKGSVAKPYTFGFWGDAEGLLPADRLAEFRRTWRPIAFSVSTWHLSMHVTRPGDNSARDLGRDRWRVLVGMQ